MKITEIMDILAQGGVMHCEEVARAGLIIISAREDGITICGSRDLTGYYHSAWEIYNRAAELNVLGLEYECFKKHEEMKAEIATMKSENAALKAQLRNAKDDIRRLIRALDKVGASSR